MLEEGSPYRRFCGVIADVLLQHVEKHVVPVLRHEHGSVHVPVRALPLAHGLRQHGTESNLDPLQCIHFREAQLAVEHVEVENIVEAQTVKEEVQAVGVVFNLDSSSPITAHESVGGNVGGIS